MAILALILRFLRVGVTGLRSLWVWLTGTKFGRMIAFGLAGSIGLYIKKAVTVIGISLVAYEFGLPLLRDYVATPMLGVPADWVAFLAMTKIDHAVTVILSAVVVQIASQVKIQRDRQKWQYPL